MNLIGTMSCGIKGPVIKKGDNLINIVCDSVIEACNQHRLELEDRDIVAVTEAVVAKVMWALPRCKTAAEFSELFHTPIGNDTI